MKSIMKKTLGLLMILCMVVCAFSFVKINADASKYTHALTAKPAIGDNVLSTVTWVVSDATNLNGYNGGNYAGVQLGKSDANGSVKFTTKYDWGTEIGSDFEGKTKITAINLWMNKGGTSITAAVKVDGVAATSNGTTVVKNSSAGKDWTKTTKVVYTPAKDHEMGAIEIVYTTEKAGYICAIEVECVPDGSDPVVDISGEENVLVNHDYKYESSTFNIEEPGDPVWASSDEDVATIDEEGNLTPIAMGTTSITATINGIESDPITVKVWPNNADPIDIETAIAIAEFAGSENSAFAYTCSGTVNNIADENNFVLFDGLFTITVYKKYGHGCNLMDQVTVNGFLKTFGETKEFSSPTISTFYRVSFNSKGGSEVDDINNVPKGSKIEEPDTPTKEGYTFVGWYKDSLYSSEWDFDSDTVNAHVRLYAKWHNNALDSLQTNLNAKNSWFSLGYKYDKNVELADPDYVKVTNVNDISAGCSVIIVAKYGENYYALSNSISNKVATKAAVTISDDKISADSSDSIKWEIGGDSVNGWTLKNGTNYLKFSGTDLSTNTSDAALFTLSYTSSTNCLFTNDSRALLYRDSANGFKCYASSNFGGDGYASEAYVFIKKNSVVTYSNVDFRIRVCIDTSTSELEGITEYGIKVATSSKNKEYAFNNETAVDGDVSYIIIDLGDVLNNKSRINEEFTICAYVKAEGETMYSTNTKTYSVYTLVKEYYDMNIEEVLGLAEILEGFGYDFN